MMIRQLARYTLISFIHDTVRSKLSFCFFFVSFSFFFVLFLFFVQAKSQWWECGRSAAPPAVEYVHLGILGLSPSQLRRRLFFSKS